MTGTSGQTKCVEHERALSSIATARAGDRPAAPELHPWIHRPLWAVRGAGHRQQPAEACPSFRIVAFWLRRCSDNLNSMFLLIAYCCRTLPGVYLTSAYPMIAPQGVLTRWP